MMDFWFGGPITDVGSLVWSAPQWQVLLAAAGAFVVLALVGLRDRPAVSRASELGLMTLALVGVVVAIAGPIWVEEEGRTEAGRVALVIDSSRSMSVLENGAPRHDAVAAVVEHVQRTTDNVDVYHFGDDLAVGVPSDYELPGTDLEGALDALSERVAGERLAAVVVVSDGLDRGLLRRRFREDGVEASAVDLPGPLTVYQIGAPSDLKDLAVRSVNSGGYAFIRSAFTVSTEIEGVGFANRTIPVTLSRNGAPVTDKNVMLNAQGKGTIQFDVVPREAGRFAYGVSVPIYEGDAVPANNHLPVVVNVVRDRIRVLQVAGAPSWDVKFLRRFLKGDPSVQLVSFFILRTQRDLGSGYGEKELSLIAFPYKQLFNQDLSTFDVVVFQNFDYEPYFGSPNNPLLKNLGDYVEQGGGLVMTGGDRSFGLANYGKTPVGAVLPVLVDDNEKPDLRPFRPMVTEAGSRHPVTRLVGDFAENSSWWGRLGEMDGTNVVADAHPDATVLLSHPSRVTDSGKPLPVLAVREVGAGRTLALTIDSSWRWSLSEAAEGRGNQAYLRFWKNSLRWLMRDPSVSRVTVETARENYAVGDEVRIVARVRDASFGPLSNATVRTTLTVNGLDRTLEGVTSPDGEVVFPIDAASRGTYQVRVEAGLAGEVAGSAQTVFAVSSRDPELDEVSPDSVFLQWFAGRTGGAYHQVGTLGAVRIDPKAGRTVWERRETPLWRSPLLALWVVLFAGLAWIVRRRSGLA
ncbi:MAG: hypothetical protein GWP91_00675 [Rhodobacterales bacterium]|nr:hypothetical protein [Rhodobacterales bacterium]